MVCCGRVSFGNVVEDSRKRNKREKRKVNKGQSNRIMQNKRDELGGRVGVAVVEMGGIFVKRRSFVGRTCADQASKLGDKTNSGGVFTAKCSEPQVGTSNGMDEGSGVTKFLSLRTET